MLMRSGVSLLVLVVLVLLIGVNIEFFLGPTWVPAECSGMYCKKYNTI